MRHSKWFTWIALAAGVAASGASTLSAQTFPTYRDQRELRNDYRDMAQDHANIDRLRADIAHDQLRLNEAIRCGRSAEAAHIAADMARDRQKLDYQLRDIRRDKAYAWTRQQDLRRDSYRNSWR
jgi:hypothetical protein